MLGGVAAQNGAFAQARPAASSAAQAAPLALIPVRGQALDLAITNSGSVYALGEGGRLWLQAVDNRTGGWLQMPGEYRAVRTFLDGSVWGLGTDDTLYRLTGSVWRAVAQNMRDVAVTPDGSVLALTAAGALQTLFPVFQAHALAPEFANPQRIHADQHGLLWLLYSDGRLARFDGLQWRPVAAPPTGAASLAIDASGMVMAVSRAGSAYLRNAQTAQWNEVFPGVQFAQVAIGPRSKPWFIGLNQQILATEVFALSAPAALPTPAAMFTRLLSWKKVPGISRVLSIAEDGRVLRINEDGNLSRWNGKDNWVLMPGRFVKVAATSGGGAWAVDAQGLIFRLERGSWRGIPGLALDIAAGPRDAVWIVRPDASIARWDAKSAQWVAPRDAGPQALAVAVGREGEPWVIGADGAVKSYQNGAWADYAGIVAVSLAVGPEGTVYATTAQQQLFWLDTRERQWKPASGVARTVAVGPRGAPWMIGDRDETYMSSLFPSETEERDAANTGQAPPVFSFAAPAATLKRSLTYQTLIGRFQDIGIGANGTVFAAGADGGLYCFSNPDKQLVFASPGQARRVAVTGAGMPWVVNAAGEIAHFDRGAWKVILDHKSQDVSVAADGSVLSVGVDSKVYRFVPAQNSFTPITSFISGTPLLAKRAAGGLGREIWAVTPNNQLLRCSRGNCELQSIGAQDVAIAPDNTVFVIDALGNVQRYNAGRRAFEAQNGRGVSIAVGPQGMPWLVNLIGQASYSGLFNVSAKLINPPNCAIPFLQRAQLPVITPVPGRTTISAVDDTATLNVGGTLNLLANDSLNGAVPASTQVSINFTSQSTALSQTDGVLRLSSAAIAGSRHTASYTICALPAASPCSSTTVVITVGGVATTAPGIPTIGTATAGNQSATVAFTAPANNGGSAITSYTVTSNPGGLTATGTASPITINGLANGTAYTFTIRATNVAGSSAASAPSNTVTPVATVPGAPAIGTATAGNQSAIVTFTAPANNGGSPITRYTVTSSPGGFTATGLASPITINGLTNGTAYTFTVRATNATGSGAASAASNSVIPVTVPGAPAIGTATAGNQSATVSFAVPASNGGSPITGYTVTSNPGGITATGAASPITVNGLANGTAYTFTVTATNAVGISTASAPSNGVTPVATVPGAPTGVTAAQGVRNAVVTFTAPLNNGGAPITSYTVISNPGGFTATGAASPITINGLADGTAYTYTVTATNAIGTGVASPPSAPVSTFALPGAPIIGTATPAGIGTVLLTFTAPINNGGCAITSYDVPIAPASPPLRTFPITVGTPNTGTISGLTSGTAYTFTVAALNCAGFGPNSAPSNSATPP